MQVSQESYRLLEKSCLLIFLEDTSTIQNFFFFFFALRLVCTLRLFYETKVEWKFSMTRPISKNLHIKSVAVNDNY